MDHPVGFDRYGEDAALGIGMMVMVRWFLGSEVLLRCLYGVNIARTIESRLRAVGLDWLLVL